MRFKVTSNGRFNQGALPDPSTCGASPSSYNLSYAWPSSPGTSYSTVRVDGRDYVYGSVGAQVAPPTNISPTVNRSDWTVGPGISATQMLSIVAGPSTANADTALISYDLTNNDTVPHTVALRVLIDTMLNNNDGAPFFVPGTGAVTTEQDYTGAEVPAFWDAFDSLTNTAFAAEGTLAGPGVTTPDRVVIARWPQIVGMMYDYTVTPGAHVTGDSAVATYWSPRTVSPGATIHLATMYGLTSSGGTPPRPPPGPRPIIFLPGITGSFLKDTVGHETWPNVGQLEACVVAAIRIPQALCDQSVLGLDALAPDGSGSTVDAANGIQRSVEGTMGGAVDSIHAPLVDKHVYDVTAGNLQNSGYAKVGPTDDRGLAACAATHKCFIPIGVDWRKSANFNAARVLALIDRVIAATGTDRVNIVAHSQGGLITNGLVHMTGSFGKIYRIVTFRTPWLGAPKLLGVLLYREPCLADLPLGGCAIDQGVAQQLVENLPGAAELNPSRAYYDATAYSPLLQVVDGGPASLTFGQGYQVEKSLLVASPLDRDTSLVDAANAFHDSVDSWSPLDPSVQLVRMIGYDAVESEHPCTSAPCSIDGSGKYVTNRQSTISAIDIDTGDRYYDTGDGTVPLNSANVYNPARGFDYRNGAHDLYFCGVSHQGLSQSHIIWEFAQFFLDGSNDYTHDDVKQGCADGTDGTLQGVDLGNTASLSLAQGSIFEVSSAGFAAGTTVTLTIQSAPLVIGSIVTDSQGRFSGTFGLPGTVPPGAHEVVADGVSPTGSLRELRVPLTVTPFGTDIGLTASISGTAYDTSTAVRLARICARAFEANTFTPAGQASTDSAGQYRISGLAPGNYNVEFTDCGGRAYRPMWYPTAPKRAGAASLPLVPGGERAQVDAGMSSTTHAAGIALSPKSGASPVGAAQTVTATAKDTASNPVGGVSITFSVTGANTAHGTVTTESSENATFSYTGTHQGVDTIAAFADNNGNGQKDSGEPSDTATRVWYGLLSMGSFVIGDQNAVASQPVTFWSAQWSRANQLSGGVAPASFKGFASTTSANPPRCGAKWSTGPGNASQPPGRPLPAYMAVIASGSITKSGSTITGDTPEVVVVKTTSGYAPDPGDAGTGTVVMQVCHI